MTVVTFRNSRLYLAATKMRLQPHYVYILGSSKGAVTTALHSHSTRQRLIGVKKDRSTPTPCHPPSPGVIPLSYRRALHNIKYLCFLSLCLALISQGRGYHRVRNSKRPRLQPRVCLHKHLSSIEVKRTCCACVQSSGNA